MAGVRPSCIWSGGFGLCESILERLQSVALLFSFALGVSVPSTDAQDGELSGMEHRLCSLLFLAISFRVWSGPQSLLGWDSTHVIAYDRRSMRGLLVHAGLFAHRLYIHTLLLIYYETHG